jgi:hypothetical protein
MNQQNRAQSINNYLDQYYAQLLKDGKLLREYQTLVKRCHLETTKLSNYAAAIKEELKNELVRTTEYKCLDEVGKQRILTQLERAHQNLKIPAFQVTEEETLEVVTLDAAKEVSVRGSGRRQSVGIINVGTAIGTFVGLGVGLIIQKGLVSLLIGGIGGSALGSLIGTSTLRNQSEKSTVPNTVPVQTRYGKVNYQKLEFVVERRKAVIKQLFNQYNQQLEAASQSISHQPILK